MEIPFRELQHCNAQSDQKKFVKYSKTVIKYSYICNVKIRMELAPRTRKNYFTRALGKTPTCGSKNEVRMATMRVK